MKRSINFLSVKVRHVYYAFIEEMRMIKACVCSLLLVGTVTACLFGPITSPVHAATLPSAVALKPTGAVAPPLPPATISFDAVANSVANNTAAILPTFSHTVAAGSNRFLVVCTQSRGSLANVSVASLTYGGPG